MKSGEMARMQWIDKLARELATQRTRRSALKAASAGAVGAMSARRVVTVNAQEATPDAAADKVEFLFVQTASSGTFTANPNAGTPEANGTPVAATDYLLQLKGHFGQTVYFSDRPERVAGAAPTDDFLEGLGFSPLNPPNAALITENELGEEITVVLELTTPEYNDEQDTLSYGVTILDEEAGGGLATLSENTPMGSVPESFDEASLFIDDCADITKCIAVSGFEVVKTLGPFPNGAQSMCWNWNTMTCETCKDSQSKLQLDSACTKYYYNQIPDHSSAEAA